MDTAIVATEETTARAALSENAKTITVERKAASAAAAMWETTAAIAETIAALAEAKSAAT
jgi:hypothetical protein